MKSERPPIPVFVGDSEQLDCFKGVIAALRKGDSARDLEGLSDLEKMNPAFVESVRKKRATTDALRSISDRAYAVDIGVDAKPIPILIPSVSNERTEGNQRECREVFEIMFYASPGVRILLNKKGALDEREQRELEGYCQSFRLRLTRKGLRAIAGEGKFGHGELKALRKYNPIVDALCSWKKDYEGSGQIGVGKRGRKAGGFPNVPTELISALVRLVVPIDLGRASFADLRLRERLGTKRYYGPNTTSFERVRLLDSLVADILSRRGSLKSKMRQAVSVFATLHGDEKKDFRNREYSFNNGAGNHLVTGEGISTMLEFLILSSELDKLSESQESSFARWARDNEDLLCWSLGMQGYRHQVERPGNLVDSAIREFEKMLRATDGTLALQDGSSLPSGFEPLTKGEVNAAACSGGGISGLMNPDSTNTRMREWIADGILLLGELELQFENAEKRERWIRDGRLHTSGGGTVDFSDYQHVEQWPEKGALLVYDATLHLADAAERELWVKGGVLHTDGGDVLFGDLRLRRFPIGKPWRFPVRLRFSFGQEGILRSRQDAGAPPFSAEYGKVMAWNLCEGDEDLALERSMPEYASPVLKHEEALRLLDGFPLDRQMLRFTRYENGQRVVSDMMVDKIINSGARGYYAIGVRATITEGEHGQLCGYSDEIDRYALPIRVGGVLDLRAGATFEALPDLLRERMLRYIKQYRKSYPVLLAAVTDCPLIVKIELEGGKDFGAYRASERSMNIRAGRSVASFNASALTYVDELVVGRNEFSRFLRENSDSIANVSARRAPGYPVFDGPLFDYLWYHEKRLGLGWTQVRILDEYSKAGFHCVSIIRIQEKETGAGSVSVTVYPPVGLTDEGDDQQKEDDYVEIEY